VVVLPVIISLAWPTAPAAEAAAPSLAQLVGQKLVVAMAGTTPDADLLLRIHRGEVGGVILYGRNITSAAALRALTAKLQGAAAAGGQPRLLIATDQEGGSVKRVPWAPPTLSPPQMGALGSASVATAQGRSAGYVLRCGGINGDLAPVADVPTSAASFMYQEGRTWSFDATRTASLSAAFASGLGAGGDIPAMKHFPGIGLATLNTDSHVVTITAPASALAPGLQPYRQAIINGIPLIMLSNATYTAYDGLNAAGWSPAISVDLLRTELGFQGVTITDSLSGTAAARGVSATSLAIKSAQAGTDMVLLTGSEASTASSYAGLLQAAQDGTVPLPILEASYNRILALKAMIADPVADATPPSLSAPRSTLYSPATLGSTTAPVRTVWSASDPCSVSSYTLERQIGAAGWVRQALATPTATSVRQSLGVGSTYRFAVKAADGAGNSTGWSFGPALVPLVRESSSTVVRFSGWWRTVTGVGYSGGSTRYATAAGAWASYTFTGTGIGWVAAVGPTRGSARVYIDGRYMATVNLHSTTTSLRRIMFATNWPHQGTHTIRIVVLGTAGHARVDVDSFVRLFLP
jgi:beta-N-acetylhexosaminidase